MIKHGIASIYETGQQLEAEIDICRCSRKEHMDGDHKHVSDVCRER